MNEIYKHAENSIIYSNGQEDFDLNAKKKDDQTNSFLIRFIAIFGIAGFLGSTDILNFQSSRSIHHQGTANICKDAMYQAGMHYQEKKGQATLLVSAGRNVGVPISFSVKCEKNRPVRVCFGDNIKQHLTDDDCFHTYTSPGKYRVEVQQQRNGRWTTLSSENIEISGIRESGLLGYSKYQ